MKEQLKDKVKDKEIINNNEFLFVLKIDMRKNNLVNKKYIDKMVKMFDSMKELKLAELDCYYFSNNELNVVFKINWSNKRRNKINRNSVLRFIEKELSVCIKYK